MEKESLKNAKRMILDQIKTKLRKQKIDLSKFLTHDYLYHKNIDAALKAVLKENKNLRLNHYQQEEILSELTYELLGLGPVNTLLYDPSISEIMINGPQEIYIERDGKLELTNVAFKDNDQLEYFVEKIVSPIGRRISEKEPYTDARLSDGSRVNIVRSPISSSGYIVTIRKFSRNILTVDDLIKINTLDKPTAEFLKACVVSRLNILISGGAGSGKTTLLNILASFVPDEERVVVIEDTREVHISKKHFIFLETRPPNIAGEGEITIRDLTRNALHMRPDRIIVGEVRSDEVLDMIQAMNTGHEGSMTTLHANSSAEALDRLEVLALLGRANISSEVAKRQLISAIDLVIHLNRFRDGSRKIIKISEMLKSKDYNLQDIVVLDENTGKLRLTRNIPSFYSRIQNLTGYSIEAFKINQ